MAATEQVVLPIEGMTCAACAGRIEKVVGRVDGVHEIAVNLATERARIVFTPSVVDTTALREAVERAGFSVPDVPEGEVDQAAEARDRRELAILVGSALLTVPLVLPMVFMPFGVDVALPGWAQWALATPVQLIAGARFYRGALSALRAGAANMDVLVSLGTTAAYGLSVALVLSGAHHLYFEAGAAVITLVLLGKWLESRAKHRAASAVRALLMLRPDTARVRRDDAWVEVRSDQVTRGERVLVRPGERVPVDGRIAVGASTLDESLLTGESRPILRDVGDDVVAGSVNGEGALQLVATAVGADSALARIAAMVEAAQASKAPVQRLADRVSAVFVPVVVGVAVVTLLAWGLLGAGWDVALMRSVAVLVVACPCALGLATPAALVVGTGAAAGAGILFRDAEALERAHAVTTVVFDKTGTLTKGRPEVVGAWPVDDVLLASVAAVQASSEHPLAGAIRRAAESRGLDAEQAVDFVAHIGRGVEATVDGRRLYVGSARWMDERGLDRSAHDQPVATHEGCGHTVVWVADDCEVIGSIALGDPIRTGAKQAVEHLTRLGIDVVLLSGDRRATARSVALELGINTVIAEVLPADKAAEVVRLQRSGAVVAMVGDGVNDAPALAAADVGIALGGGTDVAINSSGIALMRDDPRAVASAIDVSRATSRTIRQNLFWAFVYNTLGLPFAALGFLGPVLAGGAMAMSSVSVIANALRLRSWKPLAAE